MHLTEIQVRFNESITNEFACSVGSAPRLFQSKSLQQKNRCIRARARTFSRERQMLKSRDLLEVPYTEGNKKNLSLSLNPPRFFSVDYLGSLVATAVNHVTVSAAPFATPVIFSS